MNKCVLTWKKTLENFICRITKFGKSRVFFFNGVNTMFDLDVREKSRMVKFYLPSDHLPIIAKANIFKILCHQKPCQCEVD